MFQKIKNLFKKWFGKSESVAEISVTPEWFIPQGPVAPKKVKVRKVLKPRLLQRNPKKKK